MALASAARRTRRALKVTAEHIGRARRRDPQYCVVAEALRDDGFTHVHVGSFEWNAYKDGELVNGIHDYGTAAYIHTYDSGGRVLPTTLTIDYVETAKERRERLAAVAEANRRAAERKAEIEAEDEAVRTHEALLRLARFNLYDGTECTHEGGDVCNELGEHQTEQVLVPA